MPGANEIVELSDGDRGFSDCWKDEGIGGWGVERSCTASGREIDSWRGLGKVKCQIPNR